MYVTVSLLCASRGGDTYMDWDKMKGEAFLYYTFGVGCSEVELDCLTGDYRVRASHSGLQTRYRFTL